MEYKVIIPKEVFKLIEFEQDGFPGFAAVNKSLKDFEPKIVFAWNLSILIKLRDIIENGLPKPEELKLIDIFEDKINHILKGEDLKKPNALFFAKIAWNSNVELIWRIFDPALTNQLIQSLINKKDYPRFFDYRIDPDDKWELVKWYLSNV